MTTSDIASIETARAFLQGCTRLKTVNRRRSSYAWKHVAEKWSGVYVSNDDLLRAARELGLTIEPIPRSPNAWINISERDAKRKTRQQ